VSLSYLDDLNNFAIFGGNPSQQRLGDVHLSGTKHRLAYPDSAKSQGAQPIKKTQHFGEVPSQLDHRAEAC